MTTLADLVTASSQADMLAQALALMQANGLPTTAWQPASVPRTLVSIDAKALADGSTTVAAIAASGFLSTASGAWLTLLASEGYGIDRELATPVKKKLTLTAAAAAGPYTIAVGSLWAVDVTTGLRFNNTEAGTLSAGGSLDLMFQAEKPGTSYASASLTRLVTSLAGVTVANSSDVDDNDPGRDDETDDALRLRCTDQWATLATSAPDGAYDAWAKQASSSVTKAAISADGTGAVTVTIAGADGGSTGVSGKESAWAPSTDYKLGNQVTNDSGKVYRCVAAGTSAGSGGPTGTGTGIVDNGATWNYVAATDTAAGVLGDVQAYVDDRAPLTDSVTVAAASNRVVVVTGTVYATAAAVGPGPTTPTTATSTALAAAATALLVALPIGGTSYDATHKGLAKSAVEKLLLDLTGVVNVSGLQFAVDGGSAAAAADISFAADEVLASLDFSGLTWTAV